VNGIVGYQALSNINFKSRKKFFSLSHKDLGPDFHFSADFLCNIFAAFTLNGTNRAAMVGWGRTDPGLCRAFVRWVTCGNPHAGHALFACL